MFSVLCAFCMSACSDDANVDDTTLVIDVPVITDITFNSAEVKAVIKDAEFVERGVCYSTFKNPNMLNNKIVAGDATDEFSVVLKDLSRMEATKHDIKQRLEQMGIKHSTLEMEAAGCECHEHACQ